MTWRWNTQSYVIPQWKFKVQARSRGCDVTAKSSCFPSRNRPATSIASSQCPADSTASSPHVASATGLPRQQHRLYPPAMRPFAGLEHPEVRLVFIQFSASRVHTVQCVLRFSWVALSSHPEIELSKTTGSQPVPHLHVHMPMRHAIQAVSRECFTCDIFLLF